MSTKTVFLNWDPEHQFILQDQDSYQIIMKKPRGVSASDLLTMALIGCASHDVVGILEKQKQQLMQLKVTGVTTQDENPPWQFRTIQIHYQLTGKNLDEEKIHKAIKLSEENYCSVYATLRNAVEITHDFEIIEA
jgi:putative redox protein